jgi:hypothetical protein
MSTLHVQLPKSHDGQLFGLGDDRQGPAAMTLEAEVRSDEVTRQSVVPT